MQSGSIGHFLSLVQPPINKYAEKSEDPGRSLFFFGTGHFVCCPHAESKFCEKNIREGQDFHYTYYPLRDQELGCIQWGGIPSPSFFSSNA